VAPAELRHRAPFDVVHHQEVPVAVLAEVDDGDDVRVVQARRELRLVEEHVDELALVRQVLVHHLQREHPLKARLTGDARQVDLAHPSRGQLADGLVAAEVAQGGPGSAERFRMLALRHRLSMAGAVSRILASALRRAESRFINPYHQGAYTLNHEQYEYN
jgi:hypothetical protein